MLEALRGARRILVRVPNWVGDVTMATPFYASVRQSFPEARIYGGVRRYARGILEDGPWFDDLICCDDKGVGALWSTGRAIRAVRPDAAFLLPNSFRSVLEARLGGVARVYGYRRGERRWLLTGGPAPKCGVDGKVLPELMTDYYLELARWAGLELPSDRRPRLYLSESLQESGDRQLQQYGIRPGERVIGLNPGAKFGSSKCWPVAHFARLAELLETELRCRLLLFAGPGEDALAAEICAHSQATIINTAPHKVGLAQLKPLVRRCDLLVTNDTGPRHYAVAFDVPVVVLMGPTNPAYTEENLSRTIVLREDLPCSPCHLKTCPRDHACMTRILPERVVAAARQLLEAQPA